MWIILSAVLLFLMIGVGAVAIRLSLVVVTVDGESMTPTLEPGDRVLVVRIRSVARIHKGCIVLIDTVHTEEPASRPIESLKLKPTIKRVVALEGEKLILPLVSRGECERFRPERRVWDIPQGHVFVCGDNYVQSIDSRLWGPLPSHAILGVMLVKLSRKASLEAQRLAQSPSFSQGVPVGEKAPAFTAPTANGEIATLDTYHGRDLLLLFIAHTELTHRYMPFLQYLALRATSTGISVVYVSMNPGNRTQEFIEKWHIMQTVLYASCEENPLCTDYAIPGAPFYCFVDAQGSVQASGLASAQMGEKINKLRQHCDLFGNPPADQTEEETRQNSHHPVES